MSQHLMSMPSSSEININANSIDELIECFGGLRGRVRNIMAGSGLSTALIGTQRSLAMMAFITGDGNYIIFSGVDSDGIYYTGWVTISTKAATSSTINHYQVENVTPISDQIEAIRVEKVNKTVHLRVSTITDSAISSYNKLATLPYTYRPLSSIYGIPVDYLTGKVVDGSIWIDNNGNVVYYGVDISKKVVFDITYLTSH